MTYKTYDKIYDNLAKMNFTADGFVPPQGAINLIKDEDSRATFLMWIEDTGFETDENAETRRGIRKIVQEAVELTED